MAYNIVTLSEHIRNLHETHDFILSTAESCTGGLISAYITEVPGSSAYFDRSFVTYTDKAKMQMLKVSADTLDRFGAVSEMTVKEMALGALEYSDASLSVAVSGIAGPTGGSDLKPVGTVCIAFALKGAGVYVRTCHFSGDRKSVREATVCEALKGFINLIENNSLDEYKLQN